MSINRKKFLKTAGCVGLGLLAGPLAAGSRGTLGASKTSAFTLTTNEEKHLSHFYGQLRTSSFPVPESRLKKFRPVRMLKRKTGVRDYRLEYIAQNGNKIVLTRKKGKRTSKVLLA